MLRVSESRFSDSTEVGDMEQLCGGAIEGEKFGGITRHPAAPVIYRTKLHVYVCGALAAPLWQMVTH